MGGQVYHAPPSLIAWRPCCRLDPPLMVVSGDGLFFSGEWGAEAISLVGGALACLPKEVEPHAILPLGPLHTDPVRWHPGSSYAAVGGVHKSDRNPTLDVSTHLRVGMLPLGGQATGYPFQGIRRLHPQQPVHLGDSFVLVLNVTMMSSPTFITAFDDLFEAKYLSKRKQSMVASFPFLLTSPFIDYIVLFVLNDIAPRSWLYLVFLIHYFPLHISNNIMAPVI